MSKFTVFRPVRISGDDITGGVIELELDDALELVATGHLVPAADNAEVSVELSELALQVAAAARIKKPASKKAAK